MKLVIFISIFDFRCVRPLSLLWHYSISMTCQLCSVCFWFSQDWGRLLMQKQCSDLLYLAKKLLNSLLEKTGQVLRECPERGQWPGARASGCGESRNGGRWVSRDHPPRPRWAKRAQKLGATHIWDCHTKGRVKHCQTWATHCQTWAKLGQHIVNHGPHTVKIGIQIA